ncbi:MAG TPA: hypothetical protein VFJ60_04455 [Gaiella sp.]|nr:hypothetical protein [Gaiella sp.]
MGRSARRTSRFALVLTLATAAGLALLADRAPASPAACSLVTAAQAQSLLGYSVRVRRGDTAADCVLSAFPVRLDPETLSPVRPTITFSVASETARARPFRQELADARRRGFGAAPGFGSSSYLVVGPQPGALGVYAKVRGMVLELDVGPATKPITRVRALTLARRIAAGI